MGEQTQSPAHTHEKKHPKQQPPERATQGPEALGQTTVDPTAAFRLVAAAPRSAITPETLLSLQRATGNRAVQRLLASRKDGQPAAGSEAQAVAQAKPAANSAGDRHDQEADTVPTVDSGMESRINSARGSGQPLPERVRSPMERAFGADFSGVRVPEDSEVDGMTHSLQARAFTTGEDIFFKSGEYSPGSSSGQQLIAHELTHVVQQGGGTSTERVQRDGDPPPVQHKLSPANSIQRDETDVKKKIALFEGLATQQKEGVAPLKVRPPAQKRQLPKRPKQRPPVPAKTYKQVRQRPRQVRAPIAKPPKAKPAAAILPTYAGLGPMAKARVDSLAERMYAQKTEELEFKMGPMISKEPAALEIADKMLAMLKRIVDAWAKATGQTTLTGKTKGEVYEREFAFATSEKYYGAFLKTAKSIKKVFEKKEQPLRKKFHLIYNAVRNNNLSKYLEVAALELDAAAKGGGRRSQKILELESAAVGKGKMRAVRPGFAEESGLKAILEKEKGKRQKHIAEIAEKRKRPTKKGAKISVFAPDILSPVHAFSPEVLEASKSRRGGRSRGLSLEEQRTLTRGEVEDLTSAEIRQLYKMSGKSVPTFFTKKMKEKFKKDKDAKIRWEQGREYYDVILNSKVDQEAAKFKARLDAGISGSTDLMLHAAENLALKDADKMKLRLALVGWMLSNRDHSFYEIMTAAKSYGLPFFIDEKRIGYEYEAPGNFWPMDVQKIRGLLAEKQFPSYFLSKQYKDKLAGSLEDPSKSAASYKRALEGSGIPTAVTGKLGERDTAELSQLESVVKDVAGKFDKSGGPAAAKKNGAQLRRLREDPSYMYLARKFPAHGDFMLMTLMKSHMGSEVLEVLTGSHFEQVVQSLVDAGIPRTYVEALPAPDVYDLHKFVLAAKVEAQALKGAGLEVISDQFDKWTKNALFEPLMKKHGVNWGQRILGVLLSEHGTPEAQKSERAKRISEIERIAQMEETTGTWYSWGGLGSLQGWAAARSIKDYSFLATQPGACQQGPGLYVATEAWRSQSYGGHPGCGVLVAKFEKVPTIKISNKTQEAELKTLGLKFDDLYNQAYHAEMLLWYGAGYARLTTNRGVRLTTNLREVDPGLLKSEYRKITDRVAKKNMKEQAQRCGVKVGGW